MYRKAILMVGVRSSVSKYSRKLPASPISTKSHSFSPIFPLRTKFSHLSTWPRSPIKFQRTRSSISASISRPPSIFWTSRIATEWIDSKESGRFFPTASVSCTAKRCFPALMLSGNGLLRYATSIRILGASFGPILIFSKSYLARPSSTTGIRCGM